MYFQQFIINTVFFFYITETKSRPEPEMPTGLQNISYFIYDYN